MIRSRTRNGIKVAERPESRVLDQETVKLFKTQDAGYLRTMSGIEQKKIKKLEEELAFFGSDVIGTRRRKHIVFVEDEDQMMQLEPAQYFDTHPDLVDRHFNRPRLRQLAEAATRKTTTKSTDGELKSIGPRKMSKERDAKYKELEARMKRQKGLQKVERETELQRARMQKGSMVGRNKWARVRKR